ncbi:nucleotidyltransferase domain-containing protein [Luteimonas sp. A501]
MNLLFGQTRQAVLAVLLLQPEANFHLRELARMTGSHAGTLGRELDKLVAAGLVLRREQGNQVRYQADRACSLYGELAAMFRKTHGAVPVLREALAPLAPVVKAAWIFGSVALGAEVAGSDVDLFVIGDAGFADVVRAIHPAQVELGREINPVVYSATEFRRKLATGDAFAKQLLDGPMLMVMGDRDDIGEPAGDPPAAAAHG